MIGAILIVALFFAGVCAGWWISTRAEGSWLQTNRDLAYCYLAILGAVVLSLIERFLIPGFHASGISFVCGILGWALYDDFLSEAHGKLNRRNGPHGTD